MKKGILFFTALSIAFASCKDSFTKVEAGMQYRIISDNKSPKIAPGDYFEISYQQVYKGKSKDTIIGMSSENGNQLAVLDSAQIPPVYYKIFSQVRKGDSVIIKQMTDSIMKTQAEQLPPFFKRGDMIVAGYKVVNIYKTREQADSANKAIMEFAKAANYKKTIVKIEQELVKSAAQLKTDDKLINDYMTAKGITATKTKWGTYVSVTTPGEGNNIDNNSYASVLYTGKTLKDSVFDSNMDKTKSSGTLDVDMSSFSVIPGWIDGLKMMKKGSKGMLLIPSTLGYGPMGREPKIGKNEVLAFDIEVVDVLNKEQFMAKQNELRAQMMQKQAEMQAQQQKENPNAPHEVAPPQEAPAKK